MTSDELRRTVLAALGEIASEAELDPLAPDAELRETLDIDSMDLLRFVQQLAVSTGVEVPESDYVWTPRDARRLRPWSDDPSGNTEERRNRRDCPARSTVLEGWPKHYLGGRR